ncbi:hypothetical protein Patl1_20653 [Pistacia atlantica]|uniref:Uncharacterized protein n=1 Tax=Pistacia atlantica TaxID=434234 RepID=A0ACC1BIB6_9ROSI|nr:hypothetical protein Patl1_20653 [Pistacia atlantica]
MMVHISQNLRGVIASHSQTLFLYGFINIFIFHYSSRQI